METLLNDMIGRRDWLCKFKKKKIMVLSNAACLEGIQMFYRIVKCKANNGLLEKVQEFIVTNDRKFSFT